MATVLRPPEKPGLFARLFERGAPGADRRSGEDRRAGPFRGELLGAEGLASHARALARRQRVAEVPARPSRRRWFGARDIGPLLRRLGETEALLEEARDALTDAADREVEISAAGDWLLDNFYVVQEHIRDIRQNLPGSYYQELPKLADGALAGYPRVYELAIELIAHTEGHLDVENIGLFVREFQDGAPLNMGELWAIPTMLRIGLVENIRRLALRVMRRLEELESADRWAARLQEASKESPKALTDALGEFVDRHPRLTPMFVARLYQQLRAYQAEFRKLLWLEQWIAEEALTPEDAVSRSNQRLALTQVMMANHLTSLRRIARLDWDRFFESQSLTEAVLREDPSRHYVRMTFDTRDRYRHVVEDIARRARQPEEEVARQAVALAAARQGDGAREAHVGFFLIDVGRRELEQAAGYREGVHERIDRILHRHPNTVYFGGIALITALLLTALFAVAGAAGAGVQALLLLLSLVPASEIAISAVNQLLTVMLPPRRLPKMELREHGIPDPLRTVVAVPTLFPSVEVVREQLEHLEVQYLANREANLHFVILSDFTDAAAEHVPGDDAILAAAVEGIEALNRTYGDGGEQVFYLFHRPRVWSERQGVWMGWERKRGKLASFNHFLRGGPTEAFSTVVGDLRALRDVRYVITLDSDTVLPHDAAALLIGTLAHPLNAAVYDPALGRVVRGYGILQPRVGVALASAYRTRFAAIHSGHPGVDPYTTAVSDVYQDLYGEGSYTGKGIYDVAVFERATHGRFPEDALLSHDLIEGAFARAALVTDVELYDEYPASYLTHARRKHRWIRGDWQLIPWLRKRVPSASGRQANPLSTISRWKVLDNLRRSLSEIAWVALLVAGWTVLPGCALAWTALVIGAVAWPWVLGLALALVHPPRDGSWRGYYAAVGRDALVSVQQLGLTLLFLAHQAALSADAIVRTLWRLLASRRLLLQWQSASQVERAASRLERQAWRSMSGGAFVAVAAGLAAWWGGSLPVALPVVAFWLSAPAVVNLLAVSPARRELRLGLADRVTALRYALLHWRFFEQFVSVETHWLAPDNFQGTPEPVVAARTSATNIGLQLLSTVTACDLGFITTASMIDRLELVFRTLERMRRYRGHFYNWYGLRDLQVLEPAYISTVDSGNFAGHLLAVKQACLAMAEGPPPAAPAAGVMQGALEIALAAIPRKRAPTAVTELRAALTALNDAAATPAAPPPIATVRERAAAAALALEGTDESLADARWWSEWLVGHAGERLGAVATEAADRDEEATRLRVLAHRAHEYAVAMDFSLVFDSRRKLFSIGYQEATGTLDDSYYDLLASEARLASFVAIAKDDVPPEHWFRLGRSLTIEGGDTALVSWSGSMFEYLMPMLVMRSLPFTLLDQTHRGAIARHIAYGRDHGTPWGMSESAYNVRDRHGTYQYRAFGVPDLALKRGLSKDLVIAPYATLLALQFEPGEAMSNLAQLERLGALGPHGFRDAVDYTRRNPDEGPTLVDAYMAHHIGMGLVALGNALRGLRWQERFHADTLVRSAELLLGERIPRRFVMQAAQPDAFGEARERSERERERPAVREFTTPDTRQPGIALLGALPYTVMLTNAGSGYSRYGQLAVTRWRADATRDHHGQWCYIRDVEGGDVWSATYQPVCRPADEYHAVFAADRASFHRRDGDIETRMEVAVVPDDHAEVRRITLTNHTWSARELEVTSYGEIVLSPPESDAAHPVFGNLFVETEWLETHAAILASRRPRSAKESRLWCAHVAAVERGQDGAVSWETDRARFVGRGRTVASPAAMEPGAALSGTVGAVLDPVFALRVKVRVPAGRSVRLAFTTLVGETRERAIELADRYNDLYGAQRAFDLSWTRSQMELQDIGASPADSALFQQLGGHLLYPNSVVRAPAEELMRNTRGQEALWSHGISGDLPILLAMIDSSDGLPSVRQLLRAHYYWRMHGLTSDLVFLITLPPTYLQELGEELLATVRGSTEVGLLDQPGGIFIRRQDLLSPEDLTLLRTVARVHVVCDGVGLGALRDLPEGPEEYPPELEPKRALAPPAPRALPLRAAPDPAPLTLFNGLGGLTPELDYEIRLRRAELPPAPWANVIANPAGGFIVSESGAGPTWAGNSFFYRLSPWRNDPVGDAPGDVLYLRDEETGEIWSPTPSPIRHASPYTVRHGAGSSTFTHEHGGIETSLVLGVPPDDPVRIARLTITNHGPATRRLSLTSYVEWTLGVNPDRTREHVRTRYDRATQTVFARNWFDPTFAGQVAFSCMSAKLSSHTTDRREFLGRDGDLARPAALGRQALGEGSGLGQDPCAALQTAVRLAAGESATVVVLLGAADGEDAARALAARYRSPEAAATAVDGAVAAWRRRLGVIRVQTPDPSFDAILNRWTLYQALCCRMWARSAVYQSSGAFGFRDQLQDGMAFVYAEPEVTRAHLLTCAGRQFVEGDVQHWWHPQSGRGVRTKMTDDLVWLPYCADHYIRVTGDRAVLDAEAPYLRMRLLAEDEHEVYDLPQDSGETGTLYDHCVRALRRASTHGAHGLPLMGGGDWNDGMNRVGVEGKGESVWLAWFLVDTLRRFAVHAEARGDAAVAGECLATAQGYQAAIEHSAWDGAWYRRAYFDDGTPLGTSTAEECRIDSIAQSWSVISRAGDPERAATAMASLEQHLVRSDARLIMLLTPAFDRMEHDPGYIKGYLPGVRENGAQYTHAALWAVLATAVRGDGNRAFELFQMINPLTHARTPTEVGVYKVEPYVVCADVYTAEHHLGRGGWTWYTGSASWMYRVGLEAILGFRREADALSLDPCVPKGWKGFTLEYRHGETVYAVEVRNPAGTGRGVREVRMDGAVLPEGRIPLVDDGRRRDVVVELG